MKKEVFAKLSASHTIQTRHSQKAKTGAQQHHRLVESLTNEREPARAGPLLTASRCSSGQLPNTTQNKRRRTWHSTPSDQKWQPNSSPSHQNKTCPLWAITIWHLNWTKTGLIWSHTNYCRQYLSVSINEVFIDGNISYHSFSALPFSFQRKTADHNNLVTSRRFSKSCKRHRYLLFWATEATDNLSLN